VTVRHSAGAFVQSRRLAGVQTPVIPVVRRWTTETPGTISLGQGVVDYGPPAEALEAARRFGSGAADHRYGPVDGLAPLVDALTRKLAAENRIEVGASSRVLVTAGGNLAFITALLAIVDPGDEVILPAPYYFNHEMAITMAGARCVPVPTGADWQLDVGAIRSALTPRTRAVVTVSPNNPTGAVYPEAALRAVNALCRDAGVFHVSDEAYEYFVYDDASHFSAGSIDGAAAHTISLFSFSKAYGMASWRVGYLVVPEALVDAVTKVQDTLLIAPPSVSQAAAIGALAVGQTYAADHLPALDRRRRVVFDALSGPGVACEIPRASGAFYFFLRVPTRLDPLTACERLVREHRVAAIPGSAFGSTGGCSIRISYGALEDDLVEEGLRRLRAGLEALARA
jgi:aspartate/methionine/tyrosine aminotransferase